MVVLFGILFYAVFHRTWNLALSGIFAAGVVSFLDDIRPMHQLPRLLTQLIAAICIMWSVGILGMPPIWWIVTIVLMVGWVNAFNFMDGINGITVLYTLVCLLSLRSIDLLIDQHGLIDLTILSCAVLGFLNVRTKALAFAGDVGSVSIAFLLAYLMALLIVRSGQWAYLCFFSVYLIDASLTVIRRLAKRENIFEAHRRHLYQKLANEMGMPHLLVAAIYASTQTVVNILLLQAARTDNELLFVIVVLTMLAATYVLCFRSRESWSPTDDKE